MGEGERRQAPGEKEGTFARDHQRTSLSAAADVGRATYGLIRPCNDQSIVFAQCNTCCSNPLVPLIIIEPLPIVPSSLALEEVHVQCAGFLSMVLERTHVGGVSKRDLGARVCATEHFWPDNKAERWHNHCPRPAR